MPAGTLRVTLSAPGRRVHVAVDCRRVAADCRGTLELRLRGRLLAKRTVCVAVGERRRSALRAVLRAR